MKKVILVIVLVAMLFAVIPVKAEGYVPPDASFLTPEQEMIWYQASLFSKNVLNCSYPTGIPGWMEWNVRAYQNSGNAGYLAYVGWWQTYPGVWVFGDMTCVDTTPVWMEVLP